LVVTPRRAGAPPAAFDVDLDVDVDVDVDVEGKE
jgi:hypothetical protein